MSIDTTGTGRAVRRPGGGAGLAAVAALAAACSGGGDPTGPTGVATPTPEPTPTPIVASPTARYLVTFDATWSAGTHPTEFPPNPHFSGLIGGTHSDQVAFWEPGGLASEGVERMAETGAQTPLDEEVDAAIRAGTAGSLLRGEGLGRSPGRVELEFEIGLDHPLVTLVTMVAPSPDWFAGVHGLSLLEDGDWAEELVVELDAYDAGTDQGLSYRSPDQEQDPPQPISRIESAPVAPDGAVTPVGTFRFLRIDPS